MSISVELNQNSPNSPKYPYLGRHANSMIVLFTEKSTGVVLVIGNSLSNRGVGYYATEWVESNFRKLTPDETITLRNT